MTLLHRPGYLLLPTLRASNAQVVQHPADRPQGTLITGIQGSGKSAVLLRSVINDCNDPDAAVILIDPKSEVSRLALALIPPGCGKTVWFLNLAYPRFGMSPLWLPREVMRDGRQLARWVAVIADNVVLSLLDINEGQLFQASRDLLYHATIGALAIAAAHDKRPRFEDIYGLLLPYRKDLRDAVVSATAHIPDLDQTREYWLREIPDQLQGASAMTRQQMKAPRNKIGGIVGVPPLRRFFNHPVEMPLSRIVERRDILIVDANMGAIGPENAIACMHFILRMLHTRMQQQVHLPQDQRPRVALHIDEAHYIANENTVDMLATHRAAGLDVTLAHQYTAQLMSATSTAKSDKIRKGILNLCQSRFLFRLGDPEDAQEASRIAMAVYESMLRSDPDARARMRATPEMLLNMPRWHCLASWIINGQRAPSFIGQTYPIPRGLGWTRLHYQRLVDHCGEYPEEMQSTYNRLHTDTPTIVELHTPIPTPTDQAQLHANGDVPQPAPIASDDTEGHALDDPPTPAAFGGRAAARADDRQLDFGSLLADDPTRLDDPAPHFAPASDTQAPDDHTSRHRAPLGDPAAADDSPRTDRDHDRDHLTAAPPDHTVKDTRATAGKPPAEPADTRTPAVSQDRSGLQPEVWRADGVEHTSDALHSRVLRLVGKTIGPDDYPTPDPDAGHPTPPGYAELAVFDQITDLAAPTPTTAGEPMQRYHDTHLRVIKLLDRCGYLTTEQLRRAAWPTATDRAAQKSLAKMAAAGLLQRTATRLRGQSRRASPPLWSLTAKGFELGQRPPGAHSPVIPDRRRYRAPEATKAARIPHDLHAVNWLLALHDRIPGFVTDNWRTPRYHTARFTPPVIGHGPQRRDIHAADIWLGDGYGFAGMPMGQWDEIVSDLAIELRVISDPAPKPGRKFDLRFDLLVELDLTQRPAYNTQKLQRYDAFLTGWCLAHPRIQHLHTRPAVIFLSPTPHAALALLKQADMVMTASVGRLGRPEAEWYFAGRDHTLFAVEGDIHHGSLRALKLPPHPRPLRDQLGDETFTVTQVAILPPSIAAATRNRTAPQPSLP